jgi:hypothetical protein
VACCLRELGYDVGLVMCSGGVGRCGMHRSSRFVRPPFTCASCRDISGALGDSVFDVIDLNDFQDNQEMDHALNSANVTVEVERHAARVRLNGCETQKRRLNRYENSAR